MFKIGKIGLVSIAFCAVAATVAHAERNSVASHCAAFAERNGFPAEPCTCIVAAIGDNDQLSAEYLTMSAPADFSRATPALKAAIDPCLAPISQQTPAH